MRTIHEPLVRRKMLAKDISVRKVIAPRRWAWHYRTLIALRDRLRADRGEQISAIAEPLEQHSMSAADSATDEFDHDLAFAHLSGEQEALYEVEQALWRIRDGTYGICEVNGKPIAADRLRAVPWTRYCREAQAELERAGVSPRERVQSPSSVRKEMQVYR